MKARDIMTTDVVAVRIDTSVREAAAMLTEHGIASMPVLDDTDRVVGMVSESDLLRGRLPHDPTAYARRDDEDTADSADPPSTVCDVMSEVAVCMGSDADAADIAETMLENRIRALPIIDGARLVGIVSRRDLLRSLTRDDALIAAEVRDRLAELAGTPRRWHVTVRDGVVRIAGRFDDRGQHDAVTLLARTVPGVVRVHTAHHVAS